MAIHDYKNYVGFKEEGIDKSILKDATGRQRTESLFYTVNVREEALPSLYSLVEDEKNGLPSAYLIYMNSIDEMDAALKLVGSMKHWRRLLSSKWFSEGAIKARSEGIVRWREDMAARDMSLAKQVLITNAMKGDTGAARKLIDEYKKVNVVASDNNKVGRPKKGVSTDNISAIDANKIAAIHSKRFDKQY